jgi:hypothetical protein
MIRGGDAWPAGFAMAPGEYGRGYTTEKARQPGIGFCFFISIT